MPLRSITSYVPQRWIVCVLCNWAFAIITCKNSCYSSVKKIVNSVTEKKVIPTGGCPFLFTGYSWEKRELPFQLPNLYWDRNILETGTGAYKIGKLWAFLPAGIFSDLGYSKYVLVGGMLLVSASQLLLPTFAEFGTIAYVIDSFFEGIGEATIYPSTISLISRWAPPSQLNTFTAVVISGLYYGSVFGHLTFELIYMGLSSWSFGRRITGVVGIFWAALSFIFIYHSPEESPFISQHEHHAVTRSQRRMSLLIRLRKLHGIPWRQIFTSFSFYSLVSVFCSIDWSAKYTIGVTLQIYQEFILHLPKIFVTLSNGIRLSALPSLMIGGFLADWIIKHKLISNVLLKRTFAFLSVFCSSVLLQTAHFTGCNITLFWALTISALYFLGFVIPMIYSAPVDLCPEHAGLLMAIMAFPSTFLSIFKVELQGWLHYWLPDINNVDHYRINCLLRIILTIALMIPFIFFGLGTQHWMQSNFKATVPVEERPIELLEVPNSNTYLNDPEVNPKLKVS